MAHPLHLPEIASYEPPTIAEFRPPKTQLRDLPVIDGEVISVTDEPRAILAGEVGFFTADRDTGQCSRCGDYNSDEGLCLTCTYPDDPTSCAGRLYDGRHDNKLTDLAAANRATVNGRVIAAGRCLMHNQDQQPPASLVIDLPNGNAIPLCTPCWTRWQADDDPMAKPTRVRSLSQAIEGARP
jgi:hypothetical protein